MKLKLLVLGTIISSASLAQNMKKIEAGQDNPKLEVRLNKKNIEERSIGSSETSNSIRVSIEWRAASSKWIKLKRPSLSGVSPYLSKYESSNTLLKKSKNQFKVGLLGTGIVFSGLAITTISLINRPEPTVLNPNPSSFTPMLISGALLSISGAVVGTIFKTKGYRTLEKSVKTYNRELTKSGQIVEPKPIYSCSLGFQTGSPSLGLKIQF